MPAPTWGPDAPSSELHLFRSVSVRQPFNYTVSSEKRRSTSFDDTLGELASTCASLHTQDAPDPIKKKASFFWQSKLWKFSKGRKGAIGVQLSEEALAAVPEKRENAEPRWKKLIHKLRFRAKEAHKPAICSSGRDLRVGNDDECGKSKAQGNGAERQQRQYSVHPEPMAACQAPTTAPIWERRNSARPSTLDLSSLSVTGLKHLQRPRVK